jgi:Flp pilus assembly protein TadG
MSRKFSGRVRAARGQAITEFALAFTVFLLVMLGVIEFGRLLVSFSSVYAASREAARYAAAVETANDCAGIQAAAVRVGAIGGVQASHVAITYPDDPGCTGCPCSTVGLGDRVKVTVTTPFQFIVLNLPPINISSFTTRSIIKGVQIQNAVPTPTPGGTP